MSTTMFSNGIGFRRAVVSALVALGCACVCSGCLSDLTRAPLDERVELREVTGDPMPWDYRVGVAPLISEVDLSGNVEGKTSAWAFQPDPLPFVRDLTAVLSEKQAFRRVDQLPVTYDDPTDEKGTDQLLYRAAPPDQFDFVLIPRLIRWDVEYVERSFLWTTVTWGLTPIWGWFYAGETFRGNATIRYELLSTQSKRFIYGGQVEVQVQKDISEWDRGMWLFWWWSMPEELKEENWNILRGIFEPFMVDELHLATLRFVKEELGEVFREPKEKAPGKPAESIEALTRKRMALVIGVDEYESGQITSSGVERAGADAEAVSTWLESPEGGNTNPDYLFQMVGPQATKKKIEAALDDIESVAQPPDALVVYFAGNGSSANDGGSLYLLPYDADSRDVENSAVSLDWLATRLDQIKAKHVAVIFDCAFTGKNATRRFIKGGKAGSRRQEDAVAKFAGESRAVLVAAGPGQGARENPTLGGVFTYFLRSAHTKDKSTGFQKGDANEDGQVTLEEAVEFLSEKTTESAQMAGSEQEPAAFGDPGALESFNAWE